MTDKAVYRPDVDNDGNDIYWVPVVVRDRETLAMYVNTVQSLRAAYETVMSQVGIAKVRIPEVSAMVIGSNRFNDFTNRGARYFELSESDKQHLLQEYASERKTRDENHPDKEDVFAIGMAPLNVYCACGNYYAFKSAVELPTCDKFKCDLCGRTLIEYTHKLDSEFCYDAAVGQFNNQQECFKEVAQNGGQNSA